MAKSKNKNNELTYLQIPTVNSKRKTRRVKVNWSGLNYRQTMDSGVLSYEQNISTDEAPYLTPCEQYSILPITHNAENIGMIYGWDELLIAVFYDEVSTTGNIQPRIYIYDNTGKNLINTNNKQYLQLTGDIIWTDLSKINISSFKFAGNKDDTVEGNAVLFFPIGSSLKQKPIKDIIYTYKRNNSIYDNDINPWSFTKSFVDKDVIYNVLPNPKRTVPLKDDLYNKNYADYDIYKLTNDKNYNETLIYGRWEYNTTAKQWRSSGFRDDEAEDGSLIYSKEIIFPTPQSFNTTENPIPPGITSSTVFQSRVFGINKNKVYASGFADYANWELDTADNISAEHAWESTLSANPEADGELTVITAYQDRVVIFRENYMYEIRNTKNPFRVVDIFNEGCVNPNGYAIVNGMLLFASKYGLKMYTGARPKDIGYELNINQIHYACTGTDGIRWYVYCQTDEKEHNLFVYNTTNGLWSEIAIDKKIISFAKTNSALFMLDDNNTIYRIDSGDYANTEWVAETDFYSGSNINIKHIKKIQMLAEMASGSTINIHLLCDDEVFDNLTDEEKAERLLYSKTNDVLTEGTPDTPSEGTPTKTTTKTFPIRFVPRKTANYRYKIRLSGKGYSKIYQMEVITTDGGELFNGE